MKTPFYKLIQADINGAYYEFVDDDFECPPREMTKEEIEEELGYKIKIV